jgi:DNA-directed RNA polymerase subunit F
VPDVKIDAADIATGDARAKIDSLVEQTGKRRAVEAQVLAPYGTGPGKKIRKAPKESSIKTQAIPPIKQTKREFVSRIEAALQGEGSFAHMTAENPANKTMSAKENAVRNKELKADLDEMGYDAVEIDGRYDRAEKSFFVPDISEADAIEIGKKYGQESVAHSKGMLYTTGKDKGKRNPITGDVEVNNKLKNYYSEIQTKGGKVKYSVGYNFDVLTDDAPIKTQAMTAPDGKPSNLTPAQQELVNTPAFKKWFGDSKVVDENGEPKVVFHGTSKDFDIFDKKKLGEMTNTPISKLGFFFSNTKPSADQYAFISGLKNPYEKKKLSQSRVFFLNMKNPYQATKQQWNDLIDWSTNNTTKYSSPAALRKANKEFKAQLLKLGHDGVVFDDGFEIVAFEPNQIKLADGTNKTFSPDSDSIKTQVFNPKNSTEDTIKFGRENNFPDAEIKDYLVRVKKLPVKDRLKKGTKEVLEQGVDTLMALDSEAFDKMPVSFGNVKGGAKVGVKLFARVEKFMAKLNKENDKRKTESKGMPPFSEAEIMDQTIEFLEKQPAYIAEGGKRKAETDQQTQMIIDMQKSLGVNPTKGMNTRIREMRQKMVERRRGGMDLQAVKRDLRNFIRQALPTVKGSTYSKSELMKLLGKVTKADAKNINNLMEEVVDIVTGRQVKALDTKIESILNGKYEVVQAGRLKGVKIDTDTRERLERIKDAVTDEAMTAEDVVESNLGLNEEYNALNEKPDQTDADRNKMVDLMTIMSINNSKLMEDVDIDKMEALSTAEELLLGIVGEGKQTLKEQMKVDHERYVSHLVRVYKTVTGETIDPSNPELMQEAKEILKDLKNRKESRAAEKGLKKYLRRLIEKISGFKKSSESVEGLMEIIAEAPGEILGGDARKIVYEGLNAGTRVYKKRMMEATKVIQDKVKEIYGKNWRKQSRENSVRKNTGVYRTGGKEAIARAQAKHDANPTRLNKRNLAKVKAAKVINLSPNEIAQQWQQYQDPANLPSFANEDNLYFGEDHARIMAELVETIGGEDGKILEMAKWQVEEFYPSMYPHLNEAYKKIYRTNMPWNAHYAGRIKREGSESEGIDLLGRKESFNTQVGAASTKVRIKNAKPIQPMDMMGAMVTYTTDMEWFAAMGPTIRDIDKLFSNPLMRNAIENVAGESTMRLIDHHMKNIAARGVNTERGQDMVNAMNNMFATTRLGFSPNIAIKQLTSIPTYALDIGVGNYAYHAVKNKTEFLKVFNEIRNNSVYLQDRVSSDIRQVTESYSGKQDIDFVPKSAASWFTNTMMGFIKAGDITAIYLGGMPNYSFYKAEYMKANPNATEQQAIDHAIVKFESDTKSTQQSMDLQDKDFYQTSGAFARSVNLFKTSQKQYLRKEFSGLRNMRRGFRDGNMKQAAKGAVKFATFHAMMPVLFQFIASGLPGLMSDWDDEDGEDILRAAVIGNLNALFIAGDIIKGASDAVQGKPWADRVGTIPAFEFFGEIFSEYGKYATLKDPEKKQEAFMKMMTRLGELVTGGKIPMYNLRRMYMNLEKAGDAKDEKEAVLRLLNYSDYVIEGPGSDKDTMTFDPVSTDSRSRDSRSREPRSREPRSRESRSRKPRSRKSR